MPGTDGIAATEAIVQVLGIAVVVLSATDNPRLGLSAGARRAFQEPVRPDRADAARRRAAARLTPRRWSRSPCTCTGLGQTPPIESSHARPCTCLPLHDLLGQTA